MVSLILSRQRAGSMRVDADASSASRVGVFRFEAGSDLIGQRSREMQSCIGKDCYGPAHGDLGLPRSVPCQFNIVRLFAVQKPGLAIQDDDQLDQTCKQSTTSDSIIP